MKSLSYFSGEFSENKSSTKKYWLNIILRFLNVIFLTTSAILFVAAVIAVLFSTLMYQLEILSGFSSSWLTLVNDFAMFSIFISSPAALLFSFPGFLKGHEVEKRVSVR